MAAYYSRTGNYESLGKRRRDELWKACSQLGVPDSHIVLVNATRLPDNPRAKWRPDVVANLILHAIETLGIQMLVSFDPDGVSGHPNHCSIYYAAASLHMANLLPKGKLLSISQQTQGGEAFYSHVIRL